MGETLAGSNRPTVDTSGVALLAPGRASTGEDAASTGGAPRVSEAAAFAFADHGVRVMAVCPPQVHGGEGKAGFIGYFLDTARKKGVSAYVSDGANRMAAAHRWDVAPVYRPALEKGVAGARSHAGGDEGVAVRDIARSSGVPRRPADGIDPGRESSQAFRLARHVRGRRRTGIKRADKKSGRGKPTHPDLIADIGQLGYFDAA